MSQFLSDFDQWSKYDEEEYEEYEEYEQEEDEEQDTTQTFSVKDYVRQEKERSELLNKEFLEKEQGFYYDAQTKTISTMQEQQRIAEEEFRRSQEIFGIGGNFLLSQVKDILMEVFAYVPLKDLKSLSLTCKKMNELMKEKVIWRSAILKDTGIWRLSSDTTLSLQIFNKTRFTQYVYHDTPFLFPSFTQKILQEEVEKHEFPWRKVAQVFLPCEALIVKYLFNYELIPNLKTAISFLELAQLLYRLQYYHQSLDVATFGEFFVPQPTNYWNLSYSKRKKFSATNERASLRTEFHCMKSLALTAMALQENNQLWHEKAKGFVNNDIGKPFCGRLVHFCAGQSLVYRNIEHEDAASHLARALTYPQDMITDKTILLLLKQIWPHTPKDQFLCKVCCKWVSPKLWYIKPCGSTRKTRTEYEPFFHEKFVLEGILIVKGL